MNRPSFLGVHGRSLHLPGGRHRLQDGRGWRSTPPTWPNMAPNRPKWLQEGPRWPHDGPRWHPEGRKSPPRGFSGLQAELPESTKTGKPMAPHGPGGLPDRPKSVISSSPGGASGRPQIAKNNCFPQVFRWFMDPHVSGLPSAQDGPGTSRIAPRGSNRAHK